MARHSPLIVTAGGFTRQGGQDETYLPATVVVDGVSVADGGILMGRSEVPAVYVETLSHTLGSSLAQTDHAVSVITMNNKRIMVSYLDQSKAPWDVWIKGHVASFGGREYLFGEELEQVLANAYPGARMTQGKDRVTIKTKDR